MTQPQQTLVNMANQIADFFVSQGDDESAMKSIAAHLKHFWAPSMRQDLIAWLDSHDGEGMTPLVKGAVAGNREQLLDSRLKVSGEEGLDELRGGGDAG